MIYTNISGGLGNQLFEYAFAREIQHITGQGIELNTYEIENFELNRHYALGSLQLADGTAKGSSELPWFVHRRSMRGAIMRRLSPKMLLKYSENHNSFVWYENGYCEEPSFDSTKDIYIGGYWQSEKYFADIVDEIRHEIVFPIMEGRAAENEKSILNSESVCMHIRRDDYVGTDYEVCTKQYYNDSMKYIEQHVDNPIYFVFSDDIEWVKNQHGLQTNKQIIYISGNKDYEDLRLMSECRHFIMSNSSYSWWAQELCKNRGIVCAPSKWHRKWDIQDIYKNDWILFSMV